MLCSQASRLARSPRIRGGGPARLFSSGRNCDTEEVLQDLLQVSSLSDQNDRATGREQVEGFVAATLPEEILQAATALKHNNSQDNLHTLLTATFAPLEPTVPRNGHCVAHFVHLMIRSSDGIDLAIPAISQIYVGLQHVIKLVCFEELTRRRPATEEGRTAILNGENYVRRTPFHSLSS